MFRNILKLFGMKYAMPKSFHYQLIALKYILMLSGNTPIRKKKLPLPFIQHPITLP